MRGQRNPRAALRPGSTRWRISFSYSCGFGFLDFELEPALRIGQFIHSFFERLFHAEADQFGNHSSVIPTGRFRSCLAAFERRDDFLRKFVPDEFIKFRMFLGFLEAGNAGVDAGFVIIFALFVIVMTAQRLTDAPTGDQDEQRFAVRNRVIERSDEVDQLANGPALTLLVFGRFALSQRFRFSGGDFFARGECGISLSGFRRFLRLADLDADLGAGIDDDGFFAAFRRLAFGLSS